MWTPHFSVFFSGVAAIFDVLIYFPISKAMSGPIFAEISRDMIHVENTWKTNIKIIIIKFSFTSYQFRKNFRNEENFDA